MIILKPEVRITRFYRNACVILSALQTISQADGKPVTITSANDGQHAGDSRHQLDRAYDIRTRDRSDTEIYGMVEYLLRLPFCRIKIELDAVDKHWVTSADQIRFPAVRSGSQHLHVEWEAT